MSNALAIAAVTEALVQTLQGALTGINLGSSPHVSNTRPDQANGLPEVGVNVFLYQIAPNPSLRNIDLPTRAADGTLLRRPQAAIDLHYLLTFYGDDTTLEQQRLLGAVVRELHAHPVLARSMIQNVEQSVAFLAGANLDQQPEAVRFTPVNFSLEELSKLWSFLLKTDYVLSIAYVASVVLIETDDPPPPPALPVVAPVVAALPFRQPVIETIRSAFGPDAPIVAESQIVITGCNFVLDPAAGSSAVSIGGTQQTPGTVSDTQIVVSLPPGLAAGAQTVQIVQSMMLGSPPAPHQLGFQSDLATFVLQPAIAKAGSPPAYRISVGPDGGSPPAEAVTAVVGPIVRAGQRTVLELLPLGPASPSHLFDGGIAAVDTDTLVFHGVNLPTGACLARIRVDGAGSAFDLDPSGAPIAPRLDL